MEIEDVIRKFPWGNYGWDEIDIALHEDPEAQEWVSDLANKIREAI